MTKDPNDKVMPDGYSAWLIELKGNKPSYYQHVDDDNWTPDHDKALHFCRKSDAEQVIEYYGWTEAFPSEHKWHDKSPDLAESQLSGKVEIESAIKEKFKSEIGRDLYLTERFIMKLSLETAALSRPVAQETRELDKSEALKIFDNGFEGFEKREHGGGPDLQISEGRNYFFWPEDEAKIQADLVESQSSGKVELPETDKLLSDFYTEGTVKHVTVGEDTVLRFFIRYLRAALSRPVAQEAKEIEDRPEYIKSLEDALTALNNARHADNGCARFVPDNTDNLFNKIEKQFGLTYFGFPDHALTKKQGE